jgi:Uri superfamily endonuclease
VIEKIIAKQYIRKYIIERKTLEKKVANRLKYLNQTIRGFFSTCATCAMTQGLIKIGASKKIIG